MDLALITQEGFKTEWSLRY